MTNEQKAEAYLMLLNGATFREVGEKFGVSYQRIQELFPAVRRRGPKGKSIYPSIQGWINANCVTRMEFSKLIGVCNETMSSYLIGRRSPNKEIIDKILEVTGMTYEEAFKQ